MSWPSVTILAREQSALLRESYLRAFVDTSSAYYQKRIANRQRFSDGEHGSGYLWESIKGWMRISYQRFCHEVVRRGEVCVLADDHSRDQVINAPLWPYPPYSVIVLSPDLLIQLLPALPEDIYIFDAAASWTLVLTHEHDDKERICIGVGLEPSSEIQ